MKRLDKSTAKKPGTALRTWDNVSFEERGDILRRLRVVLNGVAAWLLQVAAGHAVPNVADKFAQLRTFLPVGDYILEDVPPSLDAWQWLVHRVASFFDDCTANAKRSPGDALKLLDVVLRVLGRADGDARYLLEVEYLRVHAACNLLRGKADAAAARAKVAVLSGDKGAAAKERKKRKEATATLKDLERFKNELLHSMHEEGQATRAVVMGESLKLQGRKRGLDSDALVMLFKQYDAALKDEGGTRLVILCGYPSGRLPGAGATWGGVLGDLAEKHIEFNITPKKLDEYYSHWVKLGRPKTGEAYDKAKKQAARRRKG